MADDKRPPIQPLDYISGVKVVDIGDLRIARGMSRRPASVCTHHQMYYDQQERRVWCPDCEQDIEPFDAFIALVENFDKAAKNLARRVEEVEAAEQHTLISIAAKTVDKAWRSRMTVPGCPHCRAPLFPEDFKESFRVEYGREYAETLARRNQKSTE